jgi:DNA-binding IclR family transcriptional regulator
MQDMFVKQPRRDGVQSIARAAAILRALERAQAGMTLGELAGAVALPKSTVHRLTAALRAEGLVAVGEDDRIRLGGGLAALGAAARDGLGERLRPLLAELRDELDETVDLAVLEGTAVRFVAQLPAAHRLSAVSAVGATFPAHCTANGKALLAAIEPAAVEELLPRTMQRFTPNTITNRGELLAELERVREDGFAVDRAEHTEGIRAVGAAVADATGAVAAISVPAPSARFAESEGRYTEAVLDGARRASRILGARG